MACHSLPHEAPACSWRLAGRWCHPLRGFTHAIELLDTIPGVDQRGAEVIVAEIGIDMARFETAPRLAAWAGVAPGNDESAGKQRSGKTRKGNRSLRAVLTQLAHAAVRTKGTNLSALYRHLAARRGKQRAIMAVAHSIMRSVFHMLSRNEPYRELGGTILTSGGGTIQWIGSPDGLNISGTMYPLNWRRRSWREKFSRQSGVVLLEEAREPHRCHQSISLSLPPDKSGSVT